MFQKKIIFFPIYKQYDAMDCGPTCLQMIASYYSKDYSLEDLRESSNITREGVSLRGIGEAAEKIGFRTIGVLMPYDNLVLDAPLPCIIHWKQDHYVVLYRIKKRKKYSIFYIADPSCGKIKYNEKEFKQGWLSSSKNGKPAGIAMLLDPTPSFYSKEGQHKNPKKNILAMFSYIKPYKKFVIQLFTGLLFGSFLQLLLPFLAQAVVDFGISAHNLQFIYIILIAQLVITFSSSSIEFIRGWILLHLGTRINISLISDFLTKLMRLPISYFDTRKTGDIIQRVIDHSRIERFLTNSSLSIVFSFFNVIIFGIVILIYNWIVFLIFFAGSIIYVLWVWLFMKKRAEIDNKNFAQQSENQSTMIELITGMQEIKLNTCEQQKKWKWEHIQAKIYKIGIKSLALSQSQDSGGILINQVKNIVITAFVATLVVKGELTLGMMISIQYIIGQLNSPVEQIISFLRQIQDAKLSFNRLQEIQEKENEIPANRILISKIDSGFSLQMQNVTFSYDPLSLTPTLDNINLLIPNGKKTAIVGMSGSGKTTLIKLLLGFYLPSKGKILLGNSNFLDYNIREWRKKCGVVMQDGFIFSDTIANNIAPGEIEINMPKLINAVEMARIREFIEHLPLGYNTKIGREGHGLSQGQKQRILIARAVYKDPEFLFLDEATNSLDANNEKDILENLNSFFKGRTSVLVAHRLSTVKDADQIIVVDNGKIVEIGDHAGLISMQGIYYRLVKNQLNI